jgi:hypothetical protein
MQGEIVIAIGVKKGVNIGIWSISSSILGYPFAPWDYDYR